MRNHLVLVLAAAFVTPRAALAQGAATHAKVQLDPTTFASLQERIASQDSVRVLGTFGEIIVRRPSLTEDGLLSAPDGSGKSGPRLALGDLTSIQVRGGAAGTGALIGAGVGFAGGLAIGLSLTSSLCGDGLGCRNASGGVGIIALASTVLGALAGALVGGPVQTWHTIYPVR